MLNRTPSRSRRSKEMVGRITIITPLERRRMMPAMDVEEQATSSRIVPTLTRVL